MKSNYKRLGEYIQELKVRNTEQKAEKLMGININKFFMPSVANIVGTDLSVYKIVKKNQFACNRMHVGRDYRLPISMSKTEEEFIVSPAYDVFEIKDSNVLDPEYLMMWFSRGEFDRNAWFYNDADVRGGLHWKAFCEMQLPIPSITKQREIVKEYNVIQNRISLNEQLIQKLEETAQAIYKEWFVEGIDLNDLQDGWRIEKLEKFTNLRYGKMLDSELFLENGYPVFSGYGVRGYYSEYLYEEPQILVLCRGVSGTGEVRLSPRFSFITNLSIVVEVVDPSISKMYLYYYLMNSDLKSLDSGSAQSMITSGDLYFQDALLAPTELQMRFDKVASTIMNEIEVKNKEIQILTQLGNLLLSKLATLQDSQNKAPSNVNIFADTLASN